MFRTTLVVLLAALVLAPPASARERRNVAVLPEAARTIEGGRVVYVMVPQGELGASINPSNVSGAMGGGLIGAMIDSSVESRRANNAEGGISPIRATLFDFDADAMAIETTNAATSALPWFQAQSSSFGRDNSPHAKNSALDSATASQVAFFDYTYEMLPDFSAVRVNVYMNFANKAQGELRRPEQRLTPRNLAYSQFVASLVQLPNPTTLEENSVRWAANDGALIRQALTTAFNQVGVLMPRALQLSAADIQAASSLTRSTNTHYPGSRVLEQSEGGTLLFNGGLIHVQTLSQ